MASLSVMQHGSQGNLICKVLNVMSIMCSFRENLNFDPEDLNELIPDYTNHDAKEIDDLLQKVNEFKPLSGLIIFIIESRWVIYTKPTLANDLETENDEEVIDGAFNGPQNGDDTLDWNLQEIFTVDDDLYNNEYYSRSQG